MQTIPDWKLFHKFSISLNEVFRLFQAPSEEFRTFIASILLVRNSKTLINGIYGTGKTQLVELVRHVFFTGGNHDREFGYVACNQDLTPMDVLFSLDLAALLKGEEIVYPRNIVTSPLKFINEVQRANSMVHNALLSLLAEKKVVYRDQVFFSPDYLCIMDANPHDAGSSEIPAAFKDRIDFSIMLSPASLCGLARHLQQMATADGMHWDGLAELATPRMSSKEMACVWRDVEKISIPEQYHTLSAMMAVYLQRCQHVNRAAVPPEYGLPCKECDFQADPCSKLQSIPGSRFVRSMLKLAQARAWLQKKTEIDVCDILYGLPYTLAHRLDIRPEILRLHPDAAQWIVEELYRNSIRSKIPRWQQAIDLMNKGGIRENALINDLGFRDQSIKELIQTSHIA